MKKIFLIISFFLLVSCGYQPLFSSKDSSFLIQEIIFDENDKISSKIKNGLNYLTYTKDYNKIYKLNLGSEKIIEIVSKDEKGDPSIYRILIKSDLKIFSSDRLVVAKKISKNFSYKNISNKFDLKQYEKTIEENLIDKIVEDIILILYDK
tara:strand:+ start:1117 stop:1569 length:453 start_codon:yes stop_codon:yes gene_type:complete